MKDLGELEELIERVRDASKSAAIEFVFAEFAVGMTRCKIARTRRKLGFDASDAIRTVELALVTAKELMRKFRHRRSEYKQMMAQAARLRTELDALKDTNITAWSVRLD